MKILITTSVFHPTIGGVQTIVLTLAGEFCRLGHEVIVVTSQKNSETDTFPFKVCRDVSAVGLLKEYWAADWVLQFGGVQLGWPIFLSRKPSVIVHSIWPRSGEGAVARQIRRRWMNQARNVCPSKSLAESMGLECEVIPNHFDAETFRLMPSIERNRDLVFVGRLIPEKGVDLLLDAIHRLNTAGRCVTATIVGEGPMMDQLVQQAGELGLKESVAFVGAKRGAELAALLNGHKIMVVPSRWLEPFGVVALEGIACGCVVVGSSGGGLPDAIGSCGLTFANGDAAKLAEKIELLLANPEMAAGYALLAEDHLEQHRPGILAQRYLKLSRCS